MVVLAESNKSSPGSVSFSDFLQLLTSPFQAFTSLEIVSGLCCQDALKLLKLIATGKSSLKHFHVGARFCNNLHHKDLSRLISSPHSTPETLRIFGDVLQFDTENMMRNGTWLSEIEITLDRRHSSYEPFRDFQRLITVKPLLLVTRWLVYRNTESNVFFITSTMDV